MRYNGVPLLYLFHPLYIRGTYSQTISIATIPRFWAFSSTRITGKVGCGCINITQLLAVLLKSYLLCVVVSVGGGGGYA